MDKNTIIGFLLIGLLLFGFSWYNQPSEEELARQREAYEQQQAQVNAETEQSTTIDIAVSDTTKVESDSVLTSVYGAFASSAKGVDTVYTLENEKVKLQVSSKGGQIISAELKGYTTNDGQPLVLFNQPEDNTNLSFTLLTNNDRILSTANLYFQYFDTKTLKDGSTSHIFRLNTTAGAYIDYVYTLPADDYLIDFDIYSKNLQMVLRPNEKNLEMNWYSKIKQQERSKKFENRYAQIYYKPTSDDVDKLSETSDDEEDLTTKVKWVAFKDQFFSTILIAHDDFSSATLESKMVEDDDRYLKEYAATLKVPFSMANDTVAQFSFFFGPNKFSLLEDYDDGRKSSEKWHLEEIIPLGWGIFGWVNEYCIIPIFNFLNRFISNFGIIILLLTIIIKLVLFPLTYKSYMSTAKMRVLKPQIDEINAKIPETKPQERQAAVMALYSKVGVNPMSGCVPMLLQMPILFAMFCFFPAAIELRQQSFLWAEDLSSYDAIVSWSTHIPFVSTYFGNHISLFCLLMTLTNLIYTHINMKTTDTGTNQMPGMKTMMYIMPLMFLFIFNDYASGLSYYYFISTLITILQTVIIRKTVDEERLLRKLNENAKTKKKKKSGFMQRLEEMQRQQMEMQRQAAKKRK